MSILEITFSISFICNDLDLTDILSKTENALSTAIYQSEVRQLENNIKFIVRQFASTCLSVKTPQTTQITINEHQNQPLQLQTTSCPQTHPACVEIDHEIISTAILILSAEPFKRVVVN